MIIQKISIKDFNVSLLHEQLAGLPVLNLSWAGFNRLDDLRRTPFPEESRIVGYSSGSGNDVALRGEIRFNISQALTPAEDTNLNGILAAHNATQLTLEQQRQVQDGNDLDQIRTGFQNWDALTNTQKFAVLKLAIRCLLRRERGEAI